MPLPSFRLFLGGEPADAAALARVERVSVAQGIGMAAEARLTIPIGRDESGDWPAILEDQFEPGEAIRIEVAPDGAEFSPLIEGRVVGQSVALGAGPGESAATVVARDASAFMNRDERARRFDDMAPEDIAAQIFGEHGLRAQTEASGVGAPSLERACMQRGTDYAFLRRLARMSNMDVWVEPDSAPGASVGMFRRLPTDASDLPELLIGGAARNVNRLTVTLDAFAAAAAAAERIDPADLSLLTASAQASAQRPLGEETARDFTQAGLALVHATSPDATQMAAAAQGAADRGAFVYAAEGEVSGDVYRGVLAPYRVVALAGAGVRLSGEWLIEDVEHLIDDDGYRQRFTLRRNARSAPGGGLLAGVF